MKQKLEDDTGKIHTFVLKNTYLIHGAATKVLSPQHLDQQAQDNYPKAGGTGECTMDKTMVLTWNQ